MKHVEFFVALSDEVAPIKTGEKAAVPMRISSPRSTSDFDWTALDENTACGLCYTSGTTGDPKGVLYSHRCNVLHALMAGQAAAWRGAPSDRMLPVVPMFHANGWALAFSAPMSAPGW